MRNRERSFSMRHSGTLVLLCLVFLFPTRAVPADVAQAKKEAESKGYVFYSSHDEIVARAKQEGRLRVLAQMESPATSKASMAAFQKRYPFIQFSIEQISGTDAATRNIHEIKSGMAKDWDILHLSSDFYSEYLPHLWKVDILGMAQNKVLNIPPEMIAPDQRNIVAFSTRFQVTAFNKKLQPNGRQLKNWEDILRPEFKGRKFAADIRPTEIAALVPAWGLERALDFARKVAAQQPIWVRGATRTITAMMAGEVPMMIGPNYSVTRSVMRKDRDGVLDYVILEPVPVRMALEEAIQAGARNPYAALVWLEWMASPEAQNIADEHEPFGSSVHVRGSMVEQELRGKKISAVTWDQHRLLEEWQVKVVEAYGFPTAEIKR
jgi:iron(III) transport system substrate-binding protein